MFEWQGLGGLCAVLGGSTLTLGLASMAYLRFLGAEWRPARLRAEKLGQVEFGGALVALAGGVPLWGLLAGLAALFYVIGI